MKVSSDGLHAYVTERTGALLRIDLSNANRVHAHVISAGMAAPHQIVLAEDHGHAYLVEFANLGRLLRIDLASGAQTVMADALENAIGLVMSSDLRFAYITEQAPAGGRLLRIDLANGTVRRVADWPDQSLHVDLGRCGAGSAAHNAARPGKPGVADRPDPIAHRSQNLSHRADAAFECGRGGAQPVDRLLQ